MASRAATLAIVFATVASPADAARREVTVQATPSTGPAPLAVTFIATGDATAVHWSFGDGAAADGSVVEHTYGAGRWAASWEAQTAAGTQSGRVQISAYGLTFAAPSHTRYARRTRFTGAVVPAEMGVRVTLFGPTGDIGSTRTRAAGAYTLRTRVRTPGTYFVRSDRGVSTQRTLRVRPLLKAALVGSGTRGGRYELSARVLPAAAGTLAVIVTRRGKRLVDRTFRAHVRLRLDTRHAATYRVRVTLVPNLGYDGVSRVLLAHVIFPQLAYGASGATVAQLGAQLRQFHYVAPFTSTFDSRMLDAVYAFEKVQGLLRTGTVDARFWRRLDAPYMPRPRYAGPPDHLEIDKPQQVLFVVRRSRIAQIAPISTAGLPGKFTPVGRFSIIRKVGGFDPSPLGTLYDPMYFVGGYAIHGNPSVPPYPASHGCVRVPMWIAPMLYAANPYGETVYVY
jgi:L,D-transpeptidase catalytic domain/PKD domain/Putative peptidoglycan binding domain